MQSYFYSLPLFTKTSEHSLQDITEFNDQVSQWCEQELKDNPDNIENINYAKEVIISSYSNDTKKSLDLSNLGLSSIPSAIFSKKCFVKINLANNKIRNLPIVQINKIIHLKELNVFNNLLDQEQVQKITSKSISLISEFSAKLPFILSLINSANYSEDEKAKDYKVFFYNEINSTTDPRDSLSARLGEILEFFNNPLPTKIDKSKKIIQDFSNSLTCFIESTVWKWKKQRERKPLSRELLIACSTIYARRDDVEFLQMVDIFIVKKPEIYSKANSELMILNLINLASKKTTEQLNCLIADIGNALKDNERLFADPHLLPAPLAIDKVTPSLPLSVDEDRLSAPSSPKDLHRHSPLSADENYLSVPSSPKDLNRQLTCDLVFDYIKKNVIYDYIDDIASKYTEDDWESIPSLALSNLDKKKIFLTFFYNYHLQLKSDLRLRPYCVNMLENAEKIDVIIPTSQVDLLKEFFIQESKKPICNFLATHIVKKKCNATKSLIFEIINLDFINNFDSKISEIYLRFIGYLNEENLEKTKFDEITFEITSYQEQLLIDLVDKELLKITINQKIISDEAEDSVEKEIVEKFDEFYRNQLNKVGISITIVQVKLFKEKLEEWAKLELSAEDHNSENIAKAVERIVECYKNQSESLDISSLHLKSIPSAIFDLLHLKTLEINGNLLKDLDVDKISTLVNLRKINISSNKLTKRPQFLNPELVVEDKKNPYPKYSDLSLLIPLAEFSDEEYSDNCRMIFERNGVQFLLSENFTLSQDASQDSLLITDKNLLTLLEDLKYYYSGVAVEENDLIEYWMVVKINSIIQKINFILQGRSNEFAPVQKKIFAREIIGICFAIYEKKSDPEFINAVNFIVSIEIDNYPPESLWVIIVKLHNLCNKITQEELTQEISKIQNIAKQEAIDTGNIDSQDQSENPIFNYLKNRLIFDHIEDLAMKSLKLRVNSPFNAANKEKILLNYLSAIIEKHNSELGLIFPSISYPKFSEMPITQRPSDKEVEEFKKIEEQISYANYKPLCYLMAKQILKKIYKPQDQCQILEICNLKFIRELKDKIDEMVKLKVDELKKITKNDSDSLVKIDKEISEYGKHELTNLLANQLLKINQNQQPTAEISDDEIKNIMKNFDRFYKQAIFDEKKMNLTADFSKRIRKGGDLDLQEPKSSCSKCFSSLILRRPKAVLQSQ
jgi:hypothetical protein